MDQAYTVYANADDEGYIFESKDIMKLCKELQIPRKVQVLAPQSKYFNKDLSVINDDYFGTRYQVELCDLGVGRIRRYTFPNSKIQISESTLIDFKVACQTRNKPKDYIGRDFNNEDIIFLREFFRVKKVFGGFMLIHAIDSTHNVLRKVGLRDAKSYLIIDDPIVHLSL